MDDELRNMAGALAREVRGARWSISRSTTRSAEIFTVVSRANKYIDETAPWVLAKDEVKPSAPGARYVPACWKLVRLCAGMLLPFMPQTAEEILRRVGAEHTDWESLCAFGGLPADVSVQNGPALFPRIDMEKELKELEELGERPRSAPEEDPLPEPPAAGQL